MQLAETKPVGVPGGGAAAGFAAVSMAPATLRAYRSDWRRFTWWCGLRGVCAMPAEPGTVAEYLAWSAGQPGLSPGRVWRYTPATLSRWAAAIGKAHATSGLVSPVGHPAVTAVLAGVRRSRGVAPVRKAPLLLDDLERVVAAVDVSVWPAGVAGLRDRAVLLVGWMGAFRGSEVASLTIADVNMHPTDGLHIRVRRSKTDQEGHGTLKAIPYARRRPVLCAPCAWAAWTSVLVAVASGGGRVAVMRALRAVEGVWNSGGHLCAINPRTGLLDDRGQLFRSVRRDGVIGGPITGHDVNAVVKRRAAQAGYDPATLGSHSLRAGFVTQSFRNGSDPHRIRRQTEHKLIQTLEIYAREAAPLDGNAITEMGL